MAWPHQKILPFHEHASIGQLRTGISLCKLQVLLKCIQKLYFASQLNTTMRIAILADIHGNSIALDAVLEDIANTGSVDAYSKQQKKDIPYSIDKCRITGQL